MLDEGGVIYPTLTVHNVRMGRARLTTTAPPPATAAAGKAVATSFTGVPHPSSDGQSVNSKICEDEGEGVGVRKRGRKEKICLAK